MTSDDILRIVIIVLSLAAPVEIILLNHHKRHHMNWGDVLTRLGIGVMFIAVAYGTAESYIQNLGPAPRLWVLLAALIWVNVGLLASLWHDRKLSKDERRREQTWP